VRALVDQLAVLEHHDAIGSLMVDKRWAITMLVRPAMSWLMAS